MARRLRDSQRQKVYDAEYRGFRQTDEASRNVDLAEAQEMLDILSTEFETGPVAIQRNARIKAWGGWYQSWANMIEVPRSRVPVSTILHEFSHHLAYHREVGHEGHGGGFTEAMLDVVSAWVSPEAAALLADAYAEKRCKVGGHHVLAKDEARKKREAQNNTVQEVFMVGYEDISYYSDDKVPFFFQTTTGWFDEVTRKTYQAKMYKTERGAKAAAQKLYGSVKGYEDNEAAPIHVYRTVARYSSILNEWHTRAEWDEENLKKVLTVAEASVR